MFKKMIKRAIVLSLLTALLLMMLPAPSYADDSTIWILLGLAFIVVLVINADDNLFKDMYFDAYNLETGTILELQNDEFFINDVYYDIDWLLANRTDNELWGGAGLTMKFTPSGLQCFTDETVGCNFLIGYDTDEWNWLMRYVMFEDEESLAKLEATYSF